MNEKKEPFKFEILVVKDGHSLGMSLNFYHTGRVSKNIIQSVHCS
jgi:hypothetical protein